MLSDYLRTSLRPVAYQASGREPTNVSYSALVAAGLRRARSYTLAVRAKFPLKSSLIFAAIRCYIRLIFPTSVWYTTMVIST
jgi:hypothetical protein